LDALVDLTQHDTSELEEAVGDVFGEDNEENSGENAEEDSEDAADGLLPFVSPTLTVVIIALAGIVASSRTKQEE